MSEREGLGSFFKRKKLGQVGPLKPENNPTVRFNT